MYYYLFVFIAAVLVDLLPFAGPPAWTVMVFFQMRYDLNIWGVLITCVIGSTIGRYCLSLYIPLLSDRYIKVQKNEDLRFIWQKLAGNGWRIQLFVLLYTLMPLPSTPLFTAASIAKIKPLHIIPAFFAGKFISDMVMVFSGDYAAKNIQNIAAGFLSWQGITGTLSGIIIICAFLFINWRKLLEHKKFSLSFNIWK